MEQKQPEQVPVTNKVVDFDAFRREQNKQPLVIRIGGEEVMLPPELPATVALDIIRLRKEHGDDEDMPPEVLADIGARLFGGGEAFQSLLERHQVGVEELGYLVQATMAKYNEDLPVPNRATRRAQRKARPKRRTSR